jgi:hypothetical protein
VITSVTGCVAVRPNASVAVMLRVKAPTCMGVPNTNPSP